MDSKQTNWYIIVNPHAASGKAMSKWVPAERMLYARGVQYDMAYTGHKRHAEVLSYEAAKAGRRRILAVGGDGSAHETLAGIMKWCDESGTDPAEFTMGVVPIGSGNDWIKSTNVPKNLPIVAQMVADGHTIRTDVIRVEAAQGKVSYMLNIGGIGFDSHVCQLVNLQKEAGMRGGRIYLNALVRVIKKVKPIDVQILADGSEVFSGKCYSIALGNGKYSGSGMRQVPDAVLDDGLLDYLVVPKIPVKIILKNITRLFNGKINDVPELLHGKARCIEVAPLESLSADIIEVDGEIEGRIPGKIFADGRSINVIGG